MPPPEMLTCLRSHRRLQPVAFVAGALDKDDFVRY
jgi:hypothetical protein